MSNAEYISFPPNKSRLSAREGRLDDVVTVRLLIALKSRHTRHDPSGFGTSSTLDRQLESLSSTIPLLSSFSAYFCINARSFGLKRRRGADTGVASSGMFILMGSMSATGGLL